MMEKSKRFIRIAVSVLIVLICTLLCTVCLYHNLAKKLPPDLKFYYDVYSPLMKSKVPDWIDANDRTEGQHFLKMPAHIQNAYIYEYFWKIRRPGLEEVFFSRLNYAGIHFGRLNPWQSYRGRVFLLLGPPMMIHYYRILWYGTTMSGGYRHRIGSILSRRMIGGLAYRVFGQWGISSYWRGRRESGLRRLRMAG